jgi:hypothetical protein
MVGFASSSEITLEQMRRTGAKNDDEDGVVDLNNPMTLLHPAKHVHVGESSHSMNFSVNERVKTRAQRLF